MRLGGGTHRGPPPPTKLTPEKNWKTIILAPSNPGSKTTLTPQPSLIPEHSEVLIAVFATPCQSMHESRPSYEYRGVERESTIQTMGLWYGRRILNPYISSIYHMPNQGPYLKPHQKKDRRLKAHIRGPPLREKILMLSHEKES